jgi:hypothetical protein
MVDQINRSHSKKESIFSKKKGIVKGVFAAYITHTRMRIRKKHPNQPIFFY